MAEDEDGDNLSVLGYPPPSGSTLALITTTRAQVRLEQEVLRLQALVRATQRAVALPPPKPPLRRRTPTVRARKAIAQLRIPAEATAASPEQE